MHHAIGFQAANHDGSKSGPVVSQERFQFIAAVNNGDRDLVAFCPALEHGFLRHGLRHGYGQYFLGRKPLR
jgi:hypothetical protein